MLQNTSCLSFIRGEEKERPWVYLNYQNNTLIIQSFLAI